MILVLATLTVGGSSALSGSIVRRHGPAPLAAVSPVFAPRDALVPAGLPTELLAGARRSEREPAGRLLLAIALALFCAAVRAPQGWAVGQRRVPFRETSGLTLSLRAPPAMPSFAVR